MNLSEKKLQELKEKKISIEKLNEKYFINSRDKVEVENILKLLGENICNSKEIVNKFKNIKDSENYPCLCKLLYNKEFFEELNKNNKLNTEDLFEKLIENNKLTKDDLKYLLNRIDTQYELRNLSKNTVLLEYIVDNELFQELIDKAKSVKNLVSLLENTEFFKELIENNRLNKEDLRYLLNKIDNLYELACLCINTSLIKEILNEFVLNKELVDRFDTAIKKNYWCKNRNIRTIFDRIEYDYKNNEEILKLIDLNKKVCLLKTFNLAKDQKLKLIELIQNNEIARNRLIQIVENQLENQYDFENLKEVLTKDNEKKKIEYLKEKAL